MGVDHAWSAEAWGSDAATPIAYLAGKTERIVLGTGIMQISARVPMMVAMTAASLAALSNNRFVLGLGVSGPQVVEGLHGVAFDQPLSRLRETVAIVRKALSGEKIEHRGREFQLPRPGGQGKALRLDIKPQPDLPIYLATLGPRALEFTGEVANGWLGTSFTPDNAHAYLGHLKNRGRTGRAFLGRPGFTNPSYRRYWRKCRGPRRLAEAGNGVSTGCHGVGRDQLLQRRDSSSRSRRRCSSGAVIVAGRQTRSGGRPGARRDDSTFRTGRNSRNGPRACGRLPAGRHRRNYPTL